MGRIVGDRRSVKGNTRATARSPHSNREITGDLYGADFAFARQMEGIVTLILHQESVDKGSSLIIT